METCGWLAKILREEKPAKMNIDIGGLGVGIYDRLIEQGHSRSVVNPVNFGGKPIEPAPLGEDGKPAGGPANRRSEMWLNLKKVLEAGRFSLPDSDSLQADLVGPGYKYSSDGKLLLESKDDMRRRGVPSPDEGDAVAHCFSEPDGSPIVRNKNFDRDLEQQYEGDAAVNSTVGHLLPPNWVQPYKVTPGQRVSAISNDAGTPILSVVELTK